jgi:PAS domain S-box-containing protein
LALAILIGWAGWFELQNWQAARDRGLAFVQARAQVLAQNTLRAVTGTDTALLSLKALAEHHGVDATQETRDELLGQMVALDNALPEIQNLGLVEADGRIFLSSARGQTHAPLVVADRDYFTHFRESPLETDLFVSELTQGRRDGSWFIGLSRVVLSREGRFNGVILASLDPGWFRDTYRVMSAQDGTAVALFSRGGRVVNAVAAHDESSLQTGVMANGVPALANTPWQAVFSGNSDGSLAVVAEDENGAALGVLAIERLPGLPLAVMVMQPWDDVISAFHRDLMRDAGLLAMVLLVLGGMWGPVSRAMRDRDRLFDLSPDPVCITDGSGYFLRVNPAWQNALGFGPDDLTATSHLDLVHPLDREDARRLHARLMAGEAVQDVPLRYKGRNGDSVWLSWSAVGEGGRVFAIARDITRRRDTEHALAKSEARFRDVAEALGEFIWEIDGQGILTYLSERARSSLGGPPSDFLGSPLTRLLDRNSAERMTLAMRRGTPFVMEVVAFRGLPPDSERDQAASESGQGATPHSSGDRGQLIWLRLSGVPVLSAGDGAVIGFRGAGVDVTESKTSRQALADSEARYRSIVNTVVDGIITIDERGTMQSINPAAEAIFGYSARELVGRNVAMLMPNPYQAGHDDFLAHYLDTGERSIIGCGGREVVGQRRDGSTFPLELGVSEVYFGAQRFFIGMCRDVSERKRMERLKDEFVSTVSHELRTPLTSIRGSLGLIAGGAVGALPDKAKRLVEIAHSNCQRLVNLVNDILDIQKIEAGGMAFDMTRLDLMEVARRALDDNGSYAQQFDVAVALESALPSVYVQGDFNRLLQVVTNLLSNAVKFSPQGEVVILRVEIANQNVVLKVEDHGPGISDEFRPRVFEKFSQADATDTRSKGGTGLGLSISRAITERHGGELTFESEVGKGATFIVTLPLSAEDADAARTTMMLGREARAGYSWAADLAAEDDEAQTLAPITLEGGELPKVLVIEDDPDVGHLMQLLMAADGYAVDVATSAAEARQMLAERTYHAITMDVLLPDADGLSLASEFRSGGAPQDIPMIVVSAVAQENARRLDGAALGIADWISKPIDELRLRAALRESIIGKGAAGERPWVLHVEDDQALRTTVSHVLEGVAHMVGVESLSEARQKLSERRWDVVLLDLSLPDGCGRALIADLAKVKEAPQVVIFSGAETTRADAEHVAAALEKSKVCNEDLVRTILQVARLKARKVSD